MTEHAASRPSRLPLPLAGTTVVSLEQAVAPPFATRQLADLGARVIKVERPGAGDFARGYDETVRGMSSHFVWLNRGKESIALDLKSEAGRAAVHRLVDTPDVFVQNLAPGAAERLGLGAEVLRAARDLPTPALSQAVLDAHLAWQGDNRRRDDLTYFCFRVR